MDFSCPHACYMPCPSYSIYTWLIPCNRVILQNLMITQLLKKFLAFYGTRSLLPCLQEPKNGLYLSKMNLVHIFYHFNISFHEVSFFLVLNHNFVCNSHLSHACFFSFLFHLSWFYHPIFNKFNLNCRIKHKFIERPRTILVQLIFFLMIMHLQSS